MTHNKSTTKRFQTPTINLIIGQTASHVTSHTNNENGASESVHISYCSDHFTDFNVTDDFYDFEMEDLPLEIDDDDITVDVEVVRPAISKPFQSFPEPAQSTPAPRQAPSLDDEPALPPEFSSQVHQAKPSQTTRGKSNKGKRRINTVHSSDMHANKRKIASVKIRASQRIAQQKQK